MISKFLGRKVVLFCFLGAMGGIGLFLVELSLAYSLQSFFAALGLLDPAVTRLPPWLPVSDLNGVLVCLIAIVSVRGVLHWCQIYLQEASPQHFRFLQRQRLLRYAFTQRAVSTPEIANLFGERTTQAGTTILHIVSAMIYGTVNLLLAVALAILSWPLFLTVVAFLVVIVPVIRLLNSRLTVVGKELVSHWDRTNRRLIMGIRNLLLLKIYGMEQQELQRSTETLSAHSHRMFGHFRVTGLVFAIPQTLGMVLICVLALVSKRYDLVSGGVLLSFFYLFVRFMQNNSQLALTFSTLAVHWGHLRDLYQWWADHERELDVLPAQDVQRGVRTEEFSSPISWRLEDVEFQYEGTDARIFTGLNLTVKSGETLVIVGPSGSGKSTLLALLLGLQKPTRGKVCVRMGSREMAVSDVQKSLLSQIGYVGPDSFIVEGTVRENLLFGLDRDVGDAEIRGVLKLSECEFVYDMPQGLDHRLTEQGEGLSAGQKQRISLARALLRKPKALILDEATSNLDRDTERKLVATLGSLKSKMTIVACTHRDEVLTIADQIVNPRKLPRVENRSIKAEIPL